MAPAGCGVFRQSSDRDGVPVRTATQRKPAEEADGTGRVQSVQLPTDLSCQVSQAVNRSQLSRQIRSSLSC